MADYNMDIVRLNKIINVTAYFVPVLIPFRKNVTEKWKNFCRVISYLQSLLNERKICAESISVAVVGQKYF